MTNNKTILILTFTLLASIILGACGKQTSAEAPADVPVGEVSFADDVLPIIESRCVKCHGGDKIEEGLLMRTYDEIMAGSENGPIVVPGDIEGSLMVELVTAKEMPKKGPKLTPPQIQIITNWVADGAPNN
jgi:mono/diheme cytochrome c family protein